MLKQVLLYGGLLATGTWALQALEYRLLARTHTGELYIFWVAAGFLALGVAVSMGLVSRTSDERPGDGNPQAQASLGISAREPSARSVQYLNLRVPLSHEGGFPVATAEQLDRLNLRRVEVHNRAVRSRCIAPCKLESPAPIARDHLDIYASRIPEPSKCIERNVDWLARNLDRK